MCERRPRNRRQSIRDPQRLLEKIERESGTQDLKRYEAEILSQIENRSVVSEYVIDYIDRRNARGLLSSRLQVAERSLDSILRRLDNTSLLKVFLLLLVYRGIDKLPSAVSNLLELYEKAMVFSTMIDIHRLGQRSIEQSVLSDFQEAFTEEEQALRETVCGLLEQTLHFESTLQVFINDLLHRLKEYEFEIEDDQRLATLTNFQPSYEQLRNHKRLGTLIKLIREKAEERRKIPIEIGEIRKQIRHNQDTLPNSEISAANTPLRKDIRDLGIESRRLRRVIGEASREKRRLERIFQRNNLGRQIEEYLRQVNLRQFLQKELARRDKFLREYGYELIQNELARTSPEHLLWSPRARISDEQKWTNYTRLLGRLMSGNGYFNLQRIFAELFRGYGPANSNRNYGMGRVTSIGSYPGHGKNALDFNIEAGRETRATAPDFLIVPRRFSSRLPNLSGRQVQYVRSEIVESHTRVTSDVQDVFAKIAYAILRRGVQRSTQSRDIEALMEEEGRPSNLPTVDPQRYRHPSRSLEEGDVIDGIDIAELLSVDQGRESEPSGIGRRPEARRLVAGLAFYNLTSEELPPELDTGRHNFLLEIERYVVSELNLPAGTQIFVRRDPTSSESLIGLPGNRGSVGYRSLIQAEHRDKTGAITVAINRMIQNDVNRISTRLWRFLWILRDYGALPHRKGQAVTIDHIYRDPDTNAEIRIRVFYTHLFSVDRRIRASLEREGAGRRSIQRDQPIGNVGLTGNAVSSHNHIEITVFFGEEEMGKILPDELWELEEPQVIELH
jgi:hypothetical protein